MVFIKFKNKDYMLDVHWISLIIFCAFSWFCGMVQGAFVLIGMIHSLGSKQLSDMFEEEFWLINEMYNGGK